VAGIVKLDDLGLWLSRRAGAAARRLGNAILRAAPWLMKALSVAGTAAMFLVGGGILMHGVPALHHAVQAFTEGLGAASALLLSSLADAVVGVAAGAALLAAWTGFQRLRAPAAA
jgi:predicted DNA repair protein MutK